MAVPAQVEIHLATHVWTGWTNHTEDALDYTFRLTQNGDPKNALILLLTDPVSCVVFVELADWVGSEIKDLRGWSLLDFIPKSTLDELGWIDAEVLLEQEHYTPACVLTAIQ